MRDKPTLLRPYLTVIAAEPREVVVAAGGLICDRVGQGWRVRIHVPPSLDVRALRVLGADVVDEALAEHREIRTALLTSIALYTSDGETRAEVDAALATKTTEVLLWGSAGRLAGTRSVTHRLSAAALAFKTQALLAANLTVDSAEETEAFRTTCAAGVIAREVDAS